MYIFANPLYQIDAVRGLIVITTAPMFKLTVLKRNEPKQSQPVHKVQLLWV